MSRQPLDTKTINLQLLYYEYDCTLLGMLPALDIDGEIITESDNILSVLESEFGPLHTSMHTQKAKELRKLERLIFQCWCRLRMQYVCKDRLHFFS